MITPSIYNTIEIGNILSMLTTIYNHNNSNSSNNFRYFRLISFLINNRLDYFKQFIKYEINDILRY